MTLYTKQCGDYLTIPLNYHKQINKPTRNSKLALSSLKYLGGVVLLLFIITEVIAAPVKVVITPGVKTTVTATVDDGSSIGSGRIFSIGERIYDRIAFGSIRDNIGGWSSVNANSPWFIDGNPPAYCPRIATGTPYTTQYFGPDSWICMYATTGSTYTVTSHAAITNYDTKAFIKRMSLRFTFPGTATALNTTNKVTIGPHDIYYDTASLSVGASLTAEDAVKNNGNVVFAIETGSKLPTGVYTMPQLMIGSSGFRTDFQQVKIAVDPKPCTILQPNRTINLAVTYINGTSGQLNSPTVVNAGLNCPSADFYDNFTVYLQSPLADNDGFLQLKDSNTNKALGKLAIMKSANGTACTSRYPDYRVFASLVSTYWLTATDGNTLIPFDFYPVVCGNGQGNFGTASATMTLTYEWK